MLKRLSRIVAETGLNGLLIRVVARALATSGAGFENASRRLLGSVPASWWGISSDRVRLGPNIALRGCHSGGRCFILGNGPSLEREPLHLLQNEIVITANQGYQFALRNNIVPKYHAIVDVEYLRPEYSGLVEDLIALHVEHGTVLLVGSEIADQLRARSPSVLFYEVRQFLIGTRSHRQHCGPPDLTLPQFGFPSVMHMAATAGLYMGFREICLLGCDMDYFIDPKLAPRHAGGDDRFGKTERRTWIKHGWNQLDMMQWCLGEFAEFHQIDICARTLGSRLINAGDGGALNILERIPLARLVQGEPTKGAKE